jgi:hypothetical protein
MTAILGLAIALLLAYRQWQFLMAAEQGRKQDLIKRLYHVQDGYNMLVLVPCLSTQQLTDLPQLLNGLAQQDYPKSRIAVHVVCGSMMASAVQMVLDTTVADSFSGKVWPYPSSHQGHDTSLALDDSQAMAWLIDRCLTLGSGGVFVFVTPSDSVKEDFLQNVAAKIFEYSVIQGYVALKSSRSDVDTLQERGTLNYCIGRVAALSNRMTNRVGNAGRFHSGLSALLQASGFAIKQDVLEKLPVGKRFTPRRYTLQLALSSIRIAWAPHVVVYRANNPEALPWLLSRWQDVGERCSLLFSHSLPLLTKGTFSLNNTLIDLWLDLVQPSGTLLLLTCLLGGLLSQGQTSGWCTLGALGVLLFQTLGLCVARGKMADFVTLLGFMPVVVAIALVGMPWAWFKRGFDLAQTDTHSVPLPSPAVSITTAYATPDLRVVSESVVSDFDDNHILPVSSNPLTTGNRYADTPTGANTLTPVKQVLNADVTSAVDHAAPPFPKPMVLNIPLSNGVKQVMCQLTATPQLDLSCPPHDPEAVWQYHMSLSYKSVSFSTQAYPRLDEAYDALQKKLTERGLHMVSCGSCGYFYAPSPTVAGNGFCLLNKQGQRLNAQTDGVTVISDACEGYVGSTQRIAMLQEWMQTVPASAILG